MAVHKKIKMQNQTYCGITIEETDPNEYKVDLTVYEEDVTCEACLEATPTPPSAGAPPKFD